VTWVRDGRSWEIGSYAEVAWIASGTGVSRTIRSGIPPVFAAYATVLLPTPEDGLDPPKQEIDWDQYLREWNLTAPLRHERALVEVLVEHSSDQCWWLGYLDTGASDTVFPNASMVFPYRYGWRYVLIAAGPKEAIDWRTRERGWNTAIPDLIFPVDRAWLLTTLWDDDWSCIGGTDQLVSDLLNHPLLGARTRQVTVEQDMTPLGHQTS
jgi:hypothetical protein